MRQRFERRLERLAVGMLQRFLVWLAVEYARRKSEAEAPYYEPEDGIQPGDIRPWSLLAPDARVQPPAERPLVDGQGAPSHSGLV